MILVCRSYSLPVKDQAGGKWEFVIKSWANGTENRRVYVLEQTGEFLKVFKHASILVISATHYHVMVHQFGRLQYRLS